MVYNMAIYLKDGTLFVPNKKDLFEILFFLKGVFAPESFDKMFADDYGMRMIFVENLSKPFAYMELLSGIYYGKNCKMPNLIKTANEVEMFSFNDCALYMVYYLRLALRQSAGETFIKLWTDGTIDKILDKMISEYNNQYMEFDFSAYN